MRRRVGETCLSQTVPERVGLGPTQRALARRQTRRRLPKAGEHAIGIEQTGRLDDPSDDEITEHLVGDDVEADTGIHVGQRLIQGRR